MPDPATVEITEVLKPSGPVPGSLGYVLDAPKAGDSTDIYAVLFEGWAMIDRSPPVGLEISRPEAFVDMLPFGVPRPDLGELFPGVPWAASKSGFRSAITSLRLPSEFTLDATIVCADDTRIPLWTVRGRYRPITLPQAALRPLIITALGRSGTTWLQQLLADHPDVVAYPPFESDVRAASYWIDVLLNLSEPTSYRQAFNYEGVGGDLWWVGRPRRPDPYFPEAEILHWAGREQVEALGAFCRDRIEAFYEHLAAHQGMTSALYFLEKRLPSNRRQILPLRELFPGTREVFLVRDFRDMLCSILAFNERMGKPYFGRELVDTDEEFVREQLRGSVSELERAWKERAGWAHLVRYEDLVLEPQETMRALLDFLALPAGDGDVDRVLNLGSRTGHERQLQHGTSKGARASIGRWRQDLGPELLAACEESFASALAAFGYEPA